MNNRSANEYRQLQQKLWVGTLILDVVYIIAIAWFSPKQTVQAIAGAAMGLFYIWSLAYSIEHPKKGIQAVFSILRICVFGYFVARLSDFRVYELAIVMGGLLSYKLILTVEYVAQALKTFPSLFRKREQKAVNPLGTGVPLPENP